MSDGRCNECKRELVLDEENLCAYCELTMERNLREAVLEERNNESAPSVDCGVCKVIVEEDSEGLFCDVCNSWFHNACNNTPLTYDLYALLNEAPNNVKWFCDKCIWDTEKWIKEVNTGRHKNAGKQVDYKKIVDKLTESDKGKRQENNEEGTENVHSEHVRIRQENNEEGAENVHSEHVRISHLRPEINIKVENEETFDSDDWRPTERDNYDFEKEDSYESDEWIPKEEKAFIKRQKKVRGNTSGDASHDDLNTSSEIVVPPNLSEILNYSPEKMPNITDGIASVQTKKHMRAKCDLCPKSFIHLVDCVAHKLRDHEGVQKPYKCTECESTFDTKIHRERHMSKHSKKKKICHICGLESKTTQHFKRHMMAKHSDEKPLSCTECDFRAKYKMTLTNHMINQHALVTQFQCSICNRYLISDFFLKKHLVSHSAVKPFACEVCNRRFLTERKMKEHMPLHAEVKPFECPNCDKKYATQAFLKSHMLSHVPNEERPHPCDECDQRFNTKSKLRFHKAKHSGVLECICDICGKRCPTQHDLKRHAIMHSDEKPHKCDICGKAFRHSRNLGVHIKFHKKIITARCHICGYGAIAKYIVERHIKEVHTNEAQYECDICGSKYKTKGNLTKHQNGLRGSCRGFNASGSSTQSKRKPRTSHRDYFEQNVTKQEDSPISFEESSIPTPHIGPPDAKVPYLGPTMQSHETHPSLMLYANSSHNNTGYASQYHNSLFPPNIRGITATFQNPPSNY